eukprot:gene17890-biopygen13279
MFLDHWNSVHLLPSPPGGTLYRSLRMWRRGTGNPNTENVFEAGGTECGRRSAGSWKDWKLKDGTLKDEAWDSNDEGRSWKDRITKDGNPEGRRTKFEWLDWGNHARTKDDS